jgi:hypothetical protein
MSRIKIGHIVAAHIGKTVSSELAKQGHSVCVLSDEKTTEFTDLVKTQTFLITKHPEFETPWIDPNQPVFNHKKHQQTCTKNRKARKKKRR